MVTLERVFVALLLASCGAAGGCTTISIEGAERVIERRLGVIEVIPAPGAEVMVLRTRGFGLVPSANGATLGYRQETSAYIRDPSRCQVVVFPENAAQLTAFFVTLERQGTTTTNICSINSKETP